MPDATGYADLERTYDEIRKIEESALRTVAPSSQIDSRVAWVVVTAGALVISCAAGEVVGPLKDWRLPQNVAEIIIALLLCYWFWHLKNAWDINYSQMQIIQRNLGMILARLAALNEQKRKEVKFDEGLSDQARERRDTHAKWYSEELEKLSAIDPLHKLFDFKHVSDAEFEAHSRKEKDLDELFKSRLATDTVLIATEAQNQRFWLYFDELSRQGDFIRHVQKTISWCEKKTKKRKWAELLLPQYMAILAFAVFALRFLGYSPLKGG